MSSSTLIEPLEGQLSVISASGSEKVDLSDWQFAKAEAGKYTKPADTLELEWHHAEVPGTVAAELWGDQPVTYSSSLPLDDDDFWYRVEFILRASDAGKILLHLQGLATFAEVWLDDALILKSDNMFCAHSLDISRYCDNSKQEYALCIRFIGLTPFLNQKHPRAKWRTPFVHHRNLRFVRTSLLGRTPGLLPLIPVVGPWKPVFIEFVRAPKLLLTSINVELVGAKGIIDVALRVQGASQSAEGDSLRLSCASSSTELVFVDSEDGILTATGHLEIDNPELWWPHTHGEPVTHRVFVEGQVDGTRASLELHPIGFRSIELLDPFAIAINGVQLFCRGACWRPLDFLSMNPDPDNIRRALEFAVAAGMNMLRITGETAYEGDEFYRLCDELGIMVWQDFMFARLDYPVDDSQFLESITKEATQQLNRLAQHPCLTVLCGNTEVAQQSAMLGFEREKWSNNWFEHDLMSLCQRIVPSVPYWRSSPDGGDMPFYPETGVSHYFGVGAYRQELSDAIINAPLFASECLAFGIHPLDSSGRLKGTDAAFASPADANASWTFMDVTEYYASNFFGVDLNELKETDMSRYHQLCAVTVGELMYSVQSQWRRQSSACTGALLIAMSDSIEGSGWGNLDNKGNPKAPYYHLKRAWNPIALVIVDQGVNGLKLVVHNDRPDDFVGRVDLSFHRADGVMVHAGSVDINLNATSSVELSVESVIGHFIDSSYAYRFGEPEFGYVLGELFEAQGELVQEMIFLARSDKCLPTQVVDIDIDVVIQADGLLLVTLLATSFIYSLTLFSDDLELSDNCFHLLPNRPRQVVAKRRNTAGVCLLTARGLNMSNLVTAAYSYADPGSQEKR